MVTRMVSRQQARSEETKQAILAAARSLFGERGYEAVTMREIAKVAGCSHTTIYIYFADKEALLHQLAMGPLEALREQIEAALAEPERSAEERLRALTWRFLNFSLRQPTLYAIAFQARGSRVDEAEPALAVQRLRNQLFGLLQRAVTACLPPGDRPEQLLAYTRIYFYALHGMINLYGSSEEPWEAMMERLGPTFDLAIDVLLAGFQATWREGGLRG